MKIFKKSLCALPLILVSMHVSAANVNVPFIHKVVPAEGLIISYDTNGVEKVVCIAENFYKGYLTVTENGGEKDTGIAYGNYDGQQFYFTSIGSDKSHGDVDQLHVDKSGYIKL